MAATVSALGARAGETSQASLPPSPAAATTTIPCSVAASTAASIADDWLAKRLRFATEGRVSAWFAITQSSPATTLEALPFPLQSRTRTERTVTRFATP